MILRLLAILICGANEQIRTADLNITNLKIFLPKLELYANKTLVNTSKNASIFSFAVNFKKFLLFEF